MVKMLTALVSTISNSQVVLLKNCEHVLQMQSYTHFFSKHISVFAVFNDQSFNNTFNPASILRKSTSGRHRPVSYPDGPITARYRFT